MVFLYPAIIPSREQFVFQAQAGYRVPLAIRRLADLETPISLYQKLRARPLPAAGPHVRVSSFLLESAGTGAEEGGRYSFLGVSTQRLVLRAGRLTVEGEGAVTSDPGSSASHGEARAKSPNEPQTWPAASSRPWEEIRQRVMNPRVERAGLPPLPPFLGGVVGYIGYDAVRTMEKVPDLGRPGLPLPDACLLVTDLVLAFDHAERTLWVLAAPTVPPGTDPGLVYDQTVERMNQLLADLDRLSLPPHHPDSSIPVPAAPGTATGTGNETIASQEATATSPGYPWRSTFSAEEYAAAVRVAQQHIRAGDIFQVVLSQRLDGPAPDSLDFYRALRMINPSPYLFHLDFGTFQVAGSSPEVMVRLQGRRAQVRPIAGTRPRGQTPLEQERLEAELRSDGKEQAEHVMLVDLGRNDLGRVCDYGTVHVPEQMVVERYSHVCHLVSQVEGELRPGKDAIDLLQATFPAGTVSGAPKVRAMEIIEMLEPVRRGVYAGAVGYIGWDGNMDTCIAIRTGVMVGGRLYVQAGAGIVADSVPEREYQETLQKAAALLRTAELLTVRS